MLPPRATAITNVAAAAAAVAAWHGVGLTITVACLCRTGKNELISLKKPFIYQHHPTWPKPFLSTMQKVIFFVRLQIFLHAGCHFLPPEELPPNAKND